MTRLTRLSLAHRTVVMLLSLLTIGLGVYTAGALKQELIPAFDLPRGSVLTVYPGASPQVVETEVSKPIESAVKAIAGVTTVTSKSSSGVSQVSVQWEFGIDPDDMAADIRSAIDSLGTTLPSSVDPRVITGSFDDIPIMIVALSSQDSATELSAKATDIVVPELKAVDGVRDVMVSGTETREVVITLNQKKVKKYGVDQTLIGQMFAANATALPAGTMRTEGDSFDVQVGTTFSGVDDVKALLVQGTDGPVPLGDIASVKEQPVETTSISRVNGKPSLTVSITKTAGANTVSVAHGVNEKLPELERLLGNGAEFAMIFDQAPFIEQSIHDLSVEGGIGLAMAVLVILVFLGSLRPTIITAISIPLSLLIALIGLWVGGYTLNILTLGALTVAIGRVVDDSIVVIENIKRHQGLGEWGRDSIINAVKEVAGAVTSSTLTTVAVFLPIGLVGGQAGEIFRPFAMTVTISLLASLFVSLTVVPVLASWFMRPTTKQLAKLQAEGAEEKDTWLHKAYLPVLGWSLRHRLITLVLAVAVFAGTLALAPQLKTDFIGDSGQETLQITQKLPSGTGLTETDKAATRIEAILADDPDVQTFQTTIGGSTAVFMGSQADTNQATITVALLPGTKGTLTATRLRERVADLGDVGEVDVAVGANGQSSNQVVLYVESSDPELLKTQSERVLAMMRGVEGLTNAKSDLGEARSMLAVNVDEDAAASVGMTQMSVGQAVTRAVRGQTIGSLTSGDTTLDVILRSQQPVQNVKELRNILLPVTTKMTMDARADALDEVSRRSEALQEEGKQAAADAYAEQVSALRKSRATAQKSLASTEKQLAKQKRQLKSLQNQLEAIQALPPEQQGPTVSAAVLNLTQAISGVTQSIMGLTQGAAGAKAQISAVDTQLEKLAEGRSATLESQDKQQAIADASKDAQEATADAIRLKDVAEVDVVEAPAMITRVDGTRAATLTATSEASDLGAVTTAIEDGIETLNLPDGVTVRIGGVSQQQAESFAQLGLAMLVAIAVVYLIMVATFGSLLQPLILLVSIPFAATGAIGLSLITDTPLGVPSMIGLLMLIGIVVTNAIVLIDLINQYRKGGASIDESVHHGARLRVRPIVMTALATIFALVPMGLGLTGGGVFISKPLAIVVIGGLISSTFLTLILVPVLYDLVEKYRERRSVRAADRRTRRDAGAGTGVDGGPSGTGAGATGVSAGIAGAGAGIAGAGAGIAGAGAAGQAEAGSAGPHADADAVAGVTEGEEGLDGGLDEGLDVFDEDEAWRRPTDGLDGRGDGLG